MIRFGALGAAKISPAALVYPCMNELNAEIVAIAARDRSRAERFAEAHHISNVCSDYDEVIHRQDVNAVYNPLPISEHHAWTTKALKAGKHVLCEKSLACNTQEAEEMSDLASQNDLVLMDAFHYRYHPLFSRIRSVYQSGILGTVRSIEASFHIPVTDSNDIRMKYETGGGVTMDIGCYPISWVRHMTNREPTVISARAEVGPEKVDLFLETEMDLEGIRVRTSGDMRSSARFKASLKVTGDAGTLLVNNVVAPQFGSEFTLDIGGMVSKETFDRRPTYAYQLDSFIAAVENGTPVATDGEDAIKQMRLIDSCYVAAGLPIRGL